MYYRMATENPYCLDGAKTSWTPTLAKVSYKFSWSFHLSAMKHFWIIFSMKLDIVK